MGHITAGTTNSRIRPLTVVVVVADVDENHVGGGGAGAELLTARTTASSTTAGSERHFAAIAGELGVPTISVIVGLEFASELRRGL